MEIIIKAQKFIGCDYWVPKRYGVILVEKEEDIKPLWVLLCEQDDYWAHYIHIIKVAPKEINGYSDIVHMCDYVGKTDIYVPEELMLKIPFIMYQVVDDSYQ